MGSLTFRKNLSTIVGMNSLPVNAEPGVSPGPSVGEPSPPPIQLSYNAVRARAILGSPEIIFDLAFRFGFATVFLANSWTALVDPGGFLKLIEGNFVAQLVGHYQVMLHVIAINDFILGLLILSGFKRTYVHAWAGAWLIVVTFFKITSLI
jgi:uncharacterized membrane protein YphA (DoxX/SURF4 family)